MPLYAGIAVGKPPSEASNGMIMVRCPTCGLVLPIPDTLGEPVCCGACRFAHEVDSFLVPLPPTHSER